MRAIMDNRRRIYRYCVENVGVDGAVPSLESIAHDLGISVRTVRYSITWLRRNGYISFYGKRWKDGISVLKGIR